jgi:hypothetical protein
VPTTYLKSFGKLLRRMRGRKSLATIAAQAEISAELLQDVESGHRPVEEDLARHILQRGFDLNDGDTTRVLLGVTLYDLGFTDNEFRQLAIDLQIGQTPPEIRDEIRRLYRSYAG